MYHPYGKSTVFIAFSLLSKPISMFIDWSVFTVTPAECLVCCDLISTAHYLSGLPLERWARFPRKFISPLTAISYICAFPQERISVSYILGSAVVLPEADTSEVDL